MIHSIITSYRTSYDRWKLLPNTVLYNNIIVINYSKPKNLRPSLLPINIPHPEAI